MQKKRVAYFRLPFSRRAARFANSEMGLMFSPSALRNFPRPFQFIVSTSGPVKNKLWLFTKWINNIETSPLKQKKSTGAERDSPPNQLQYWLRKTKWRRPVGTPIRAT